MRRLLFLLLLVRTVPAQTVVIKHHAAGTAATPTFSPAAGAVSNPTTVTISTATSGCSGSIYWSTTNNPPTTGDTNGTAISVTTAETIYAKVIGCLAATDSAEGSAAYTISVGGVSVDDTFAYSNNSSLATASSGYWVNASNTMGVWSNLAFCNNSYQHCISYWAHDSFVGYNDQWASVKLGSVVAGGNNIRAAVRVQSGGDGYYLIATGATACALYKRVGGTESLTGAGSCTWTTTPATGDVIKISVIGTTVKAYQNGTLVGTWTAIGSDFTAGQPGFNLDDTGTTHQLSISEFKAGNN